MESTGSSSAAICAVDLAKKRANRVKDLEQKVSGLNGEVQGLRGYVEGLKQDVTNLAGQALAQEKLIRSLQQVVGRIGENLRNMEEGRQRRQAANAEIEGRGYLHAREALSVQPAVDVPNNVLQA